MQININLYYIAPLREWSIRIIKKCYLGDYRSTVMHKRLWNLSSNYHVSKWLKITYIYFVIVEYLKENVNSNHLEAREFFIYPSQSFVHNSPSTISMNSFNNY